MTKSYDVIVVGGGMVGAAVACILGRGGVEVALLDCFHPPRHWPVEPIDNRVSALTKASQNILQTIGVWPAMEELGVCAYQQMRVWDGSADGELHFDSADTEYRELGHIVENRVTVACLWNLLESLPTVSLVCPAKVVAMQETGAGRRLLLDDGRAIEGQLVLAADGRDSVLRKLAGIGVTGWPYRQQGLVATVTTEAKHQATAWQRFLEQGPLAFLPLYNGQSSIVWTLTPETATQYQALPEHEFLQALEQASAGILGKMLHVGPRATFPLRYQFANCYIADHFALLGDAAHAMHPLAGQGANSGLLDAAAIAELVLAARLQQRPIGGRRLLRHYERWRKGDNLLMMSTMDALKRIYGASSQPMIYLRSKGMNGINRTAVLKRMINRYAMGLRGDLPKLAEGVACWQACASRFKTPLKER